MMMSVIYNDMSYDDDEEEENNNPPPTEIRTISQTVDTGQSISDNIGSYRHSLSEEGSGLSQIVCDEPNVFLTGTSQNLSRSVESSYNNNFQCSQQIFTVSDNVDNIRMGKRKEPERPPPPIVDKVTHHTIELYWDEALAKASTQCTKNTGRIKVCLQEQDKHLTWVPIYTGYGKRHTVTCLDPQTEYHFRIRFMNNYGNSEWSPHVNVSTTKEPLSGEHLHNAVISGDVSKVASIIETGDVKIDVPDKFGFTPLMQASQKGYADVVECLLENGANVNEQNSAGKSALMLACFAGQLVVAQMLREHGAKFDQFDRGGSSPLHWAVDGGNTHLIEWMIRNGAKVNLADKNCGWTPLLRCASVHGRRDVAYTLIVNGGDVNAKDSDHKTALMIAIINGHLELVELLLNKGADLSMKNDYQKTAYQMAVSMEKRRIIKLLDEFIDSRNLKGIKI